MSETIKRHALLLRVLCQYVHCESIYMKFQEGKTHLWWQE